jgi:hypothetical protein
MSMTFSSVDRPDRGLQHKLKNEDTSLTKIPMPICDNSQEQNFQELLASERYQEVISNVNHYLSPHYPNKINLNNKSQYREFSSFMVRSHFEIIRIERNVRPELEQLAIKLVTNEFHIPKDSIQWDVKIVDGSEISTDDFNMDDEETIQIPEVDLNNEIDGDFERLNLERAKRRLINAISQGASKKGHYSYHLVGDEILDITKSDTILDLYGVMMSINDTTYWQFPDMFLSQMGKSGQVAGTEEIEQGEPPIIKVRAQNFPVAVHECIKGYLELLAVHGRPRDEKGDFDEELWTKVSGYEDTMDKEMWDLRLGPSIWNRVRSMLPDEVIIDENEEGLQSYFLSSLYTLEAKEFLTMMKEVIGKTSKGEKMIKDYYDSIRKDINKNYYDDSMSIFNDNDE